MAGQAMGVYSKTRLYPEEALSKLPETVKGFEIPFNSNSLSSSQNSSSPGTITGRRDAAEPMLGNIDCTGDIVTPVDTDAFGYLLAAAFGRPTTTPGKSGTNLYTHVFKPGKTQPSFSVEKVFSNGVYSLINGVKVNQIEMTFGGDGELTATVGFIGCKETINDAAAATDENITKVGFNRLNNFQASLKIDGTDVAIATELSLTIPFGLDDSGYAIGSGGFRTRINEGIISPTGKLTAFFDDKTFIEKAMTSKITQLQVTLTKGDKSLVVDIPEVMFARKSPGIDGTKGITQELDYSAFYKENSLNSCIQFTLVNGVATYEF